MCVYIIVNYFNSIENNVIFPAFLYLQLIFKLSFSFIGSTSICISEKKNGTIRFFLACIRPGQVIGST